MSQPEQNTIPKLPWVKPELIVIDVNHIKQQEEEALQYLTSLDLEQFKLNYGGTS